MCTASCGHLVRSCGHLVRSRGHLQVGRTICGLRCWMLTLRPYSSACYLQHNNETTFQRKYLSTCHVKCSFLTRKGHSSPQTHSYLQIHRNQYPEKLIPSVTKCTIESEKKLNSWQTQSYMHTRKELSQLLGSASIKVSGFCCRPYLHKSEKTLSLLSTAHGHHINKYKSYFIRRCYTTHAALSPTIFSVSSGHGKCGVAIVRVSGPAALTTLEEIGRFKETPAPRKAILRHLIDPKTHVIVDKALVLYFPGEIHNLIKTKKSKSIKDCKY